MGLPRWSTRAVWPWAKGRGQTGTRCQGCSSPRNADLGGQEGSRALGTGGQKTGSGQASWPCPLVSRLCPAAQVPQSEGSCHLLERKGQKSRGSSLFRHLETRLDFLSTVGSGGQRGTGPEEGVQAPEWRCSEHVSTRMCPQGGGPGIGLSPRPQQARHTWGLTGSPRQKGPRGAQPLGQRVTSVCRRSPATPWEGVLQGKGGPPGGPASAPPAECE